MLSSCQKKERPPDDSQYNKKNPKNTKFSYHDDDVWRTNKIFKFKKFQILFPWRINDFHFFFMVKVFIFCYLFPSNCCSSHIVSLSFRIFSFFFTSFSFFYFLFFCLVFSSSSSLCLLYWLKIFTVCGVFECGWRGERNNNDNNNYLQPPLSVTAMRWVQ